jgi:hypothetical protein
VGKRKMRKRDKRIEEKVVMYGATKEMMIE